MSTIPPQHRSTALIGLAAVLAAQIPATIQSIPDPLVRSLLQVSVLVMVIALAWKAQPPKDPPIPPSAPVRNLPADEPITIPDPPLRESPGGSPRLRSMGLA